MQVTDEVVTARARIVGLDPKLVKAVVLQESGGNASAWKPEPRYRYFWNVRTRTPFRTLTAIEIAQDEPPADFQALPGGDRAQEWWGQQASWGPMQVMGAVARERNFSEMFFTELCDPVVGLAFGCGLLSDLVKWAGGNVEQALAAYNGGKGGNLTPPYRNADYASKVLARFNQLKGAGQ